MDTKDIALILKEILASCYDVTKAHMHGDSPALREALIKHIALIQEKL